MKILDLLIGIGVGGILFTHKGKQITNEMLTKCYDSLNDQIKELNIFNKDEKDDKSSQTTVSYPKSFKNAKND